MHDSMELQNGPTWHPAERALAAIITIGVISVAAFAIWLGLH